MRPAELIGTAEALDRHAGALQAIARAIAVAAGDNGPESSPENPA
jgi:hypothetical protein